MSRACRILVVLAAIMGADGVILAAASAHQADAGRLASASSMLLFHASAVLATVALANEPLSMRASALPPPSVLSSPRRCSPAI